MTTVESVITSFGEAEAALREFLEQAKSLGVTERRLAAASETVESATTALETARKDLASGTAQLSASAERLGETAGQFRVVAELLEQLNPADLAEGAQETLAEMHKLGTRIQKWIVEHDEKLDASREQLLGQIAGAEAKIEALQVNSASLHAESAQASLLAQSRLDSVKESLGVLSATTDDQMAVLRDLAATTEGLASRQKLVLLFVLVAAALSAGALGVALVS